MSNSSSIQPPPASLNQVNALLNRLCGIADRSIALSGEMVSDKSQSGIIMIAPNVFEPDITGSGAAIAARLAHDFLDGHGAHVRRQEVREGSTDRHLVVTVQDSDTLGHYTDKLMRWIAEDPERGNFIAESTVVADRLEKLYPPSKVLPHYTFDLEHQAMTVDFHVLTQNTALEALVRRHMPAATIEELHEEWKDSPRHPFSGGKSLRFSYSDNTALLRSATQTGQDSQRDVREP